ncbi:hypothetical protein [Mucilaginibacter sp.]|uniref:hypothetical protein n=1 Tax=Mucilaginibacter sp. TaxID=1882438 RepID=UPI003B00D712
MINLSIIGAVATGRNYWFERVNTKQKYLSMSVSNVNYDLPLSVLLFAVFMILFFRMPKSAVGFFMGKFSNIANAG